MSAAFCSFCEDLPGSAPRNWGGTAGKCPVCKQALWITSSGVTYRLYSAEELAALPASASKWRWLAGLGVGLAAGVCLVALSPFNAPVPKVALVAEPAEVAVLVDPARQEPRPPRMTVKRAYQPAAARVKPIAQRPAEKPAPVAPPVPFAKAAVKPMPFSEPTQVKGSTPAFPAEWQWSLANSTALLEA